MHTRNASILLIDGSPSCLAEIAAPLNGRGYRVTQVRTAREGLDRIYRTPPDMLLLDRDLPDMDGLHFCSELKNDVVLRQIPIILMDAGSLPEGEIFAGEAGADDFVKKPVNLEELDGRIRQVFRLGTLGINCHPVTGLPGYNSVYRRLQAALEQGAPFAVCFMDIRGFRRFNQVHGYERGDEILASTARLVSRALDARDRLLDFLGHLGSDDFVLITDPAGVEDLCTDIIERFEWDFPDLATPPEMELAELTQTPKPSRDFMPERIFLSVAVLTCESGCPAHPAELIDQGRSLLAKARREDRSRWVKKEYEAGPERTPSSGPGVLLEIARRKSLNGSYPERADNTQLADHLRYFRELVLSQALQLHFQPIIYLDSGRLYGYEALLRGPEGSYLESPVILFNLARKLDMEQDLDLVCLSKLLGLVGGIDRDTMVFFNVSPESFFSPKFRESCDKAASGLVAERVVLEVTRKRRIREFPDFRESIRHFRGRGYRVAVDDVKAGTLSLRTVLELEPDFVKTDISVVRNIHRDPSRQRVFQQFRAICARQRITLIPEGVESEQEKEYLLQQGARLGQGFLFSPPQPLV